MSPKLPNIPEDELTGNEAQLMSVIRYQTEVIQELRDEIARLKGQKGKPKIRPSKLGDDKGSSDNKDDDRKNKNGKRRSKKDGLKIDEEKKIKAETVPEGSEFKGHVDWDVQCLELRVKNIRLKLERWRLPDGSYKEAELPSWVKGHYNAELVSYVMHQYYGCHVTQPLIWEQLQEMGIDISESKINEILVGGHEEFHEEKDEILSAGIEVSEYINVDDTGARHDGKNGYCTHIGNEIFAWFESTESKSRINFLRLLQKGVGQGYVINEEAIGYMRNQKLREDVIDELMKGDGYVGEDQWEDYLQGLRIKNERHVKIATEAGLIGGLIANGINTELAIISDDAGQFNIWGFLHGLCWMHAERPLKKMVGFSEEERKELEEVREEVWAYYDELKAYKKNPEVDRAIKLKKRFDEIFLRETKYEMLKEALRNIHAKKDELLLVLKRPEVPLHNNTGEQNIREYVKKRKISGSTRSDPGRQCRDTFTSLKKTARKLGLSFWEYLNDRISSENHIPSLGELIRQNHLAPNY